MSTYEIVTHESAENGEAEEQGWLDEQGEEFEVGPDLVQEAADYLRSVYVSEVSASHFHQGMWYSDSPEENYRDGSWTTKSYHLKDFTAKEEQAIYEAMFGRKAERNPSPQISDTQRASYNRRPHEWSTAEKRELIRRASTAGVTLDGHPAAVGGALLDFAGVRRLDGKGGRGAEYAWGTVAYVLNHCEGAFRS